MAVITISRLVGSGGTLIGKEVAKRLNYHYVDKDLIQEIMEQYGELEFKKIYDTKLTVWDKYSGITDSILDFFKRIMLSIAKVGNVVIIGRGSFFSLGKYNDVLDTMIYAPMETRVKVIMEMRNISEKSEAEKYILQKEQIRQSFIERTYKVQWNHLDNFDMVFNTGKLSSSLVIETMVMAVQALDKNISASGFSTSEIAEDIVLDKTVKKLLKS
jgi:cytidylate kinase